MVTGDLDRAVMDLRQVRMVVRVRTAAMGMLLVDLVVGMARVVKGRVEDLEMMEHREMVLGRETMKARTATLDQEATEARTITQVPTTVLNSQAPGNRTKAV